MCRCVVDEFFIHAIHVADFAAAYTDITGWYIAVGAEIFPKAEDEGLAEAHDFTVALSAG